MPADGEFSPEWTRRRVSVSWTTLLDGPARRLMLPSHSSGSALWRTVGTVLAEADEVVLAVTLIMPSAAAFPSSFLFSAGLFFTLFRLLVASWQSR